MMLMVVMGVAGCGKSSLGRAIASKIGVPMIEGDDFHPPSNIEKMRAGTPLTDADRTGWLDTLGEELRRHRHGAVLSCSALKRAYRDRLRSAVPDLKFVFLDIDRQVAFERVMARASTHVFPPSLVDSQFAALEPPLEEKGVLRVSAAENIENLTAKVCGWVEGGCP